MKITHNSKIYSDGKHDFLQMTPVKQIRKLLQDGADPNSNSQGYNAFHCALNYGDKAQELFTLMFTHGTNPNSQHLMQYKNTPLHHYLVYERPDLVVQFINTAKVLNKEIDFNLVDIENKTVLILAAKLRQTKAALYILENTDRININAQDKAGMTALHYACALGQLDLVKALITKGANLSLKNKKGQTPLDCTNLSEKEIKEIFTSVSIDPDRDEKAQFNDIRDMYGSAFVDELAKLIPANIQNKERVKSIIREKRLTSLINQLPNQNTIYLPNLIFFTQLVDSFTGISLLKACIRDRDEVKYFLEGILIRDAAAKGRKKELESLLQNNGWMNVNTSGQPSGKTALHRAASNGHTQICALLIQQGAGLNMQDAQGNTPSTLACENKHNETVLLLHKSGADIAKTNRLGENVFSLAFKMKNEALVDDLLDEITNQFLYSSNTN